MTGIGSLTVDLVAQTASFNANIQAAANKLNSNAAKMNRSLQSIEKGFDRLKTGAATLTAVVGGAALIAAAGRALDYAGSLGEVSQQIGVTIKDLQVYRYAATQVNLTQEEMEKGLAKLSVTIGKAGLGSKSESASFDALGVSVRDASGHIKTASDIMPELADRLARIPDPAKRAAVEVALFGRAGQKLDPLLTQGSQGLKRMEDSAKSLGVVLDDDLAAASDKAADRLAELKVQLEANFARTVAENANSILFMANSLSTLSGQAVRFVNEYPRLSAALAGAAAGSRFGLPGAAVGAAIGFGIANRNILPSGDDLAAEIELNARQLDAATRTYRGKSNNYINFLKKRREELISKRESDALGGLSSYDIMGNPKGLPKPPPVPEFEVPDFLAGSGGSGGKGTSRGAEDSAKLLASFKAQSLELQNQLNVLQLRNAGFTDEANKLEDQVALEKELTQIREQYKGLDPALVRDMEDLATHTITLNQETERFQEKLAQLDGMKIEIEIDIPGQLERDIAELAKTIPDLRTNMQKTWDTLEEMAPQAFDSVTHGIEEVLLGFSSMGDAIRSIAAELASMALQAFVFAPLKAAIGIPGFATGTNFAPGGLAVVGEKGPELVNLPRGSQVVPNHRMSSFAMQRAASSIDRRQWNGPLVGQMVFPNVRTAREARETMQQGQAAMRRLMADNAKAGY